MSFTSIAVPMQSRKAIFLFSIKRNIGNNFVFILRENLIKFDVVNLRKIRKKRTKDSLYSQYFYDVYVFG